MKRVGVLIVILALLTFSTVNHSTSSIPADIVDEAQEAPFLTAADGDVSSESIGEDYGHKFRETSDDDELTYPDSFNKTFVATSGDYHENLGSGSSWTCSQEDDSLWFCAHDTTDGDPWISLTWATPNYRACDAAIISILDVFAFDNWGTPPFLCLAYNIYVYDHTAAAYELLSGPHTQSAYNSHDDYSLYTEDPDHFGGDFKIMLNTSGVAGQKPSIGLDYTGIEFHYMTQVDADHYGDSFFDVSDWSLYSNEGTETMTSDDDVGTFAVEAYVASYDSDYVYSDTVSLTGSYYYEIRYRLNTTAVGSVVLCGYSTEGFGDNVFWQDLTKTTSWITKRFYDSDTLERVAISLVKASAGQGPIEIEIDFLRVGPSDEMGCQHDCSTTEGVTDGGGGSSSSDGSELTLTADADGSIFEFTIDTTATAAYLDADYYPMIGLDFNDADSADYVKVESYDGAAWATVIANTTIGTDTLYANCRAADADIEKFRISVNPSANPRLKWFKAFSIANFTVTQFNSEIDDVLYVSDGHLYCENDGDSGTDYLQIEYDPALSVSDTYSVWNLTISNIGSGTGYSYDYGFRDDTWGTWYFDTTRGPTPSGTMDDFKVIFYDEVTVSAIKFIEDSTAPDILDKFVNPTDPDDDESITFTAVTYDALEVWEVTINAVAYPAGFSDVDYEMTEQTADVLWSYEFSTLLAGYYLFQVTASDCANTYSEYIPVTVRESTITVEEITLIGAGSDFTMMQFSARINKDCSYVIYEESANNAEAATHSGSVSEPSFNLAWTKLDTTDTNVNFTIKFTNGTLTYNYTSQYQVAQTVLSVTSYDWGLSETQVTLSYQTSKSGTYTLYLDDVQDATSSFVAGSNFLNWSRPSAVDPAEIDAAVKLTDGTTTIWLNQTYSEYSLTAFSIRTLFMDLTDPSISAIFTTSWGNATGYLYEADVQKATGAEGTTLSYTKSTTAGTYNVALKIDAGGEVAWYNTTYTIATTELRVEEDRIETSDTYAYCRGYLTLNADYKVYEETVEVATGSVNAGSIEIRWTKASNSIANVTVLFTSGGQEYPVYGSYQVAAQVTFVVESWWMDLNLGVESYVEFYVLSSFENATVYVYDNNTLMTTVTESAGGAYSYFWLSESEGLHTITLNITHGATVHSRTRTYYVPDWAATGLVVRWDLWTFQDNYTMLELGSNWMNCTYYVYLNSSLVATSANDPVTLNFTREINIGTYNLTIYADGGTQTYSIKNIRYIITEEGVSYDYSSITGGRSVRYGDNYNYYTVTTEEPAPGILIDQGTAAIVSVGGFLIIFTAFLAARELRKREILKTERIFGK